MKVVWFVNDEFPDVASHFGRPAVGGSGWWMKSLGANLSKTGIIELVIVCDGRSYTQLEKLSCNSITYYCIPRGLFSTLSNLTGKQIDACQKIIDIEQPDIVHVFGSENFWGLLAEHCRCPVVLRMQGVLNELYRCFRAKVPLYVFIRYPYLLFYWYLFRIRLKRERRILRTVHYFEGQSDWDENIVKAYNPQARYFRNAPILRSAFFGVQWNLASCQRNTITVFSSNMPYKGVHILISALPIIIKSFPNCRLKLIGHMDFNISYGAYCYNLIRHYGIETKVDLVKSLNAHHLAEELCKTHVFVVPSFNENESNSLLEAMSVGTPCVASAVGGITSMAEDGVTARLVPAGQPEYLALAIIQLFSDDSVAVRISKAASALSRERHNSETILVKTIQMYNDVVQHSFTNNHRE